MKNKFLIASSAAALLAMASSAYATTSVGVEASFNGGPLQGPTIVTDNGVGDLNPLAGQVAETYTFSGLTMSLVFGGPNSSGTSLPVLDLVINGVLDPGANVKVIFSATGFTLPVGGSPLLTDTFNGNGYTFSAKSWTSGTGGALFDETHPLISIGALSALGTASASGTIPAGTSNPYSITIEADLSSLNGTVNVSATSVLTTVPDGGNTMIMLGSALSILGLGAFRRKAVKA